MRAKHESLGHTSDLGLWVEAEDLSTLFAGAAEALGQVMWENPPHGEVVWRSLDLNGDDLVDLLIRYLNELIYLFDAEEMLCVRVDIAIDQHPDGSTVLVGRVGLVDFDPAQHHGANAVKAATYHQAKLVRRGNRWRAEVFLDV
jgi:SHS2 domain-containing protein